ncbi:uncharacterized protein [Macrobrachium rosenbergii]|uniref:uncharacterized protein n=1 Tax=Macrobrachium rosenbergii TaxID=79674 RepID=UPI0034D41302
MQELATENPGLYRNFIRIMEELFNEIVEHVTPYIKKTLTFWRRPIEPGLRVAITPCYLATGESYRSLSYQFCVAANTICSIVPEICRAIAAAYGDEVMQVPSTPEEWKEVARVVDAEYKFLYVDVGAIGSESDGGVFAKTQLGKMLDRHEAKLPAPERSPNETEDKPPVDYFFTGEDAFALKKYMMKPHPARWLTKPECIYNY